MMFLTTRYKQDKTIGLTSYIHEANFNGKQSITWQVNIVGNGIIAHGIAKTYQAAKYQITKAINQLK